MNCPHCGRGINVGALIGSVSTAAKAAAARENGKLGGRPKKKPMTRRKAKSGNDKLRHPAGKTEDARKDKDQ